MTPLVDVDVLLLELSHTLSHGYDVILVLHSGMLTSGVFYIRHVH